jgi:hypothetical protein
MRVMAGVALVVLTVACASQAPPPSPLPAPDVRAAPSATPTPDAPVAAASASPPARFPPAPPCDASSWKTALLPGCEPLTASVRRVTASGNPADAARATDTDSCTTWNSNDYAPQSITLDLGEPRPVGHVIVVPNMTPDGPVSQVVEVSDDGVTFEQRARYDDRMFSGGVFGLTLQPAARARFVRVRTLVSPSWVAWFEVVPVACANEAAVPPRPAPPPPPPPPAPRPVPWSKRPGVHVLPGKGACRTDADCRPDACCSPSSCTSGHTQSCDAMGACPAVCRGPMDCGNGACGCVQGRCAVWTTSHER